MPTRMLQVGLLALVMSAAWLGLPDAALGGPCTPTTEVCDDADNDCDGEVDEGMGLGQVCTKGCGPGTLVCDGIGGVTCDAPTPSAEICDGADNDCDGSVDEDPSGVGGSCQNTVEGVGSCPGVVVCSGAEGLFCQGQIPTAEICDELDNDCDGAVDEGPEICDGHDNDCDTLVDEGFEQSEWFADADDDTYGNSAVSVQSCGMPLGHVANDEDCDDDDPRINPDADEVCDPAEADEDCDGFADEEQPSFTCDDPIDVDGDGEVKAFTDVLLLLRWKLGFTGNVLIDGVVGNPCKRCTADDVIGYIEHVLLIGD